MTKIPPKPKNYQNTPETQKITKIPLKSKINKITLKPKNDQNTPKTLKNCQITPKLKI